MSEVVEINSAMSKYEIHIESSTNSQQAEYELSSHFH